ncbi:MAG: phosphate signaling complex protein PhoU [Spirochaetota bacterium]|nr:phosphate signaling complex protein PhoU [Spirochaetota bacterium]
MKIRLDDEINKLRKSLLEMGNAVEEAIGIAIKALKERDTLLAKQVIKNDVIINRLEIQIDKSCLKIFALKQPIAFDLRFVASSLKVNNDLERMGDFASRIAEDVVELASELDGQYTIPQLNNIYKMAEIAQLMVKLCMEAFMQKNVEIAQRVIKQDDEVDRYYDAIIKESGPYVHEDPERFQLALSLINIGKCLERIGDHAKNICEDAIYTSEGEIVKHQTP